MIALKNQATSSSKMTLEPYGNLFNDDVYEISLTVCGDPMCDCGAANMHIKKESVGFDDPSFTIPIDVNSRIVQSASHNEFYVKDGKKGYIRTVFAECMTDEDWLLLYDQYYAHKFDIINRAGTADLDYEFDNKYHEDMSLMFPFELAFPCSAFRYVANGMEYLVFDSYCKNPTCPCTRALFSIMQVDVEHLQEIKIIGGYHLDYKTKEVLEVTGDNPAFIQSLFKTVQQKHPDMDKILDRRGKITKTLYDKDFDRYHHKPPKNRMLSTVGRNDPCPCGSGKKYKRCCLKK